MDRVIAALGERQLQIGKPPAEASPTDPRERVNRALTYCEQHRLGTNYPVYHRLYLPLTSEAVLQRRADYLSDSTPLASF